MGTGGAGAARARGQGRVRGLLERGCISSRAECINQMVLESQLPTKSLTYY
jgi:hypothetical protein